MSDLIKKMGLKGSVQKRPKPPTSPKEIMSSSMTATVDNNPQILRPLRPYTAMVGDIPPDLSEKGKLVLIALFSCFEKSGFVKEGVITDLIWGFVDVSQMDPVVVAHGLVDLKRAGYVEFKSPAGEKVDEHSSNLKDCFLCYTPKLLDLVHSEGKLVKKFKDTILEVT